MIQIGICDDDLSVLGQIQRMMDHYRVSRNEEMVTLPFQSPLELIHEIERGRRFDILLMDVLMPGENGMEAAKEIRRYDTAVRIIFLTSSQEFAVDSYKVGAFFTSSSRFWRKVCSACSIPPLRNVRGAAMPD